MKCWKKTRILENKETVIRNEKLSIRLPRCGHKQNVPCPVAARIDEWSGVSCEEVGVVKEGIAYGLQDFPCHIKSSLKRKCGHNLALPCSEAFAKSTSLDSCREMVTTLHPNCGHKCQVMCTLASALREQNILLP